MYIHHIYIYIHIKYLGSKHSCNQRCGPWSIAFSRVVLSSDGTVKKYQELLPVKPSLDFFGRSSACITMKHPIFKLYGGPLPTSEVLDEP